MFYHLPELSIKGIDSLFPLLDLVLCTRLGLGIFLLGVSCTYNLPDAISGRLKPQQES